MFGVLVDVSGSMRTAYALDRSSDANVDRTHAVFTTIMNIVKREVVHHNRQDSIFVCAFGLETVSADPSSFSPFASDVAETRVRETPVTCDLVSLLEYIAGPKDSRGKGAYQGLIDLAKRHKAPHAEPWITKHLSELEARILHRCLCSDTSLIPKLIELIPSQSTAAKATKAYSTVTTVLSTLTGGLVVEARDTQESEAALVHRSQAYKLAREIIENARVPIVEQPTPRPVQDVSELLDYLLLQSKVSSSAFASARSSPSESLHDRIHEFLEHIKPYIYGGTPMCKALNDAVSVFKKTNSNPKVLFVLSDGQSADGNPRPIAQQLRGLGVTIVTCFLTSDHIDNPRRLSDEADPDWRKSSEKGTLAMFEMSSTIKNTHTPVSYLIDANWELPPSGVSRLFVRANSLDVVNEMCKIVVSQMTKNCDALVHILEKVPLAIYINQKNAEFEPKTQEGGTCYANAIAAVFHLAMHRIVDREGGIPDFLEIRDRIIKEYGVHGAATKKVLEKVCPEYRLHFRQVDETGARRAINERRPVVATFMLYDPQWTEFSAFYNRTPKGILNKSDVTGEF